MWTLIFVGPIQLYRDFPINPSLRYHKSSINPMKSLFFLVKTAGFHIFPIVSFGFPMVFKPPMGLPLSLRLQCEDPHQPRALYDELEDARVKPRVDTFDGDTADGRNPAPFGIGIPMKHCNWLVVWNMFFFSYIGKLSSQLTNIFQRG